MPMVCDKPLDDRHLQSSHHQLHHSEIALQIDRLTQSRLRSANPKLTMTANSPPKVTIQKHHVSVGQRQGISLVVPQATAS